MRSPACRIPAVLLGLGAALTAIAAVAAAEPEPPGTPVSFLACPVARDTGPDTDLCFFAEHAGRLYALTNPPDYGAPQLRHRILVEGRVKPGPPVCGAVPIEGRASVMPEIDASCDVVLPFDGVIKGVAGGVFNSGTPEQRAAAQDLARRAALDPRLSLQPAILDPPPLQPPAPPFEARTLIITYSFDSDRGSGPDMLKLKELALFARTAKAKRVSIVGYRAASRLSDGEELAEGASLAQARAQKIASILAGLQVDAARTQVDWEANPIQGTGEDDWQNRKVRVTVTP